MTRRTSRGQSDRKSPTGRLRIVAGKWRSRLLPVADAPGLRPTAARIRETLFNWLADRVEGARCLDLFAGTGALGFEALSRGAREVVFVDSSAAVIGNLKSSAESLGADGATFVQGDAVRYLARPAQAFDLVFIDPPFASDVLEDLCRLLEEGGWLNARARIYLEQDRDQPLPSVPDGWTIVREKTAGRVRYALAAVN
jgi:16S rRNA (guanine966-N2)-methyltransferase